MKKPNRLINEKSPYLLQHAYNPVNWYAWGEEPFELAAVTGKPLFLSIGYSTCHWCHVMEHESFEDEEVAALMNDTFVSIKVDREERPDIDGVYMNVCQMMTGSGGWPLTILLTPDKKPFFAGTYFPKESRFGRPGIIELILKIKELWQTKREDILKSADEITVAVMHSVRTGNVMQVDEKILDRAFNELKSRYDISYGGFGSAPKFPTPHNLVFLLRYWKRKNSGEALKMVEETLMHMRIGGIYDHVGFGFHRYSTDREWLVPHFEKMLYDQALICLAYIEAYQITKNTFYKNTAEEILAYVKRDMTSAQGGFYSAEDADSEGEEGKFYLWRKENFNEALNMFEADLAAKYFNVDAGSSSNVETGREDNLTGELNGAFILHTSNKLSAFTDEQNKGADEFYLTINTIRKKLFELRSKRTHPYKDDKILTDWNSLMISAFVKASLAFENENYLFAAEECAAFILKNMRRGEELLHRHRDNESGITAYIDDYAFFISALLDLYEATFKIGYLKDAILLNGYLIKHFWDNNSGGFFFTGDKNETTIMRRKEIYDGAVPSGNSIEMMNLLRLSRITSNTEYESYAALMIKAFSEELSSAPSAYTQMLTAVDFALGPAYEIVIAGELSSAQTQLFIKAIREKYLPNKSLVLAEPGGSEIISLAPFAKEQAMVNGKAAVYICRNFKCEMPVTSVAGLKELLKEI